MSHTVETVQTNTSDRLHSIETRWSLFCFPIVKWPRTTHSASVGVSVMRLVRVVSNREETNSQSGVGFSGSVNGRSKTPRNGLRRNITLPGKVSVSSRSAPNGSAKSYFKLPLTESNGTVAT